MRRTTEDVSGNRWWVSGVRSGGLPTYNLEKIFSGLGGGGRGGNEGEGEKKTGTRTEKLRRGGGGRGAFMD